MLAVFNLSGAHFILGSLIISLLLPRSKENSTRSPYNHALTINSSSSLPASTLASPSIPGFKITYDFHKELRMPPGAVYIVAIQMMWELAVQDWKSPIRGMAIAVREPYDVLIVFVNPRVATDPVQLQVAHTVVALYEAILVMTDRVCFCLLRSRLKILHRGSWIDLGGLSITPAEQPSKRNNDTTPLGHATRTVSSRVTDGLAENDGSISTNPISTGQITDPENNRFKVSYTYLGRKISSKDVSLAVLGALATIAQYNFGSPCDQFEILSDRDQVVTIAEAYDEGAFRQLTHRDVARALKLMYDDIQVATKTYGDIYLELLWEEKKFGEIRMLKAGLSQNGTHAVADA